MKRWQLSLIKNNLHRAELNDRGGTGGDLLGEFSAVKIKSNISPECP